MMNGFYPSIISKQSSAERWLPNYLKTYIERDVRMIRNIENLVISEIKKNRFNKNQYGEMYYLRDSAGNEVDLVLEKDGNLIPVEIKSSVKTSRSDYKNLKWFQRLYRINHGLLINQSKESQELEDGIINIGWAEVVNV
jgi:hypothetical protein